MPESIATNYLNAIDDIGVEELLHGYEGDNVPIRIQSIAKQSGLKVLVTDYCRAHSYSYNQHAERVYISFAAWFLLTFLS